jgi:hypothetical protein
MLEKYIDVQISTESAKDYVVKRILDAEKVPDKHLVCCYITTNHNISV